MPRKKDRKWSKETDMNLNIASVSDSPGEKETTGRGAGTESRSMGLTARGHHRPKADQPWDSAAGKGAGDRDRHSEESRPDYTLPVEVPGVEERLRWRVV